MARDTRKFSSNYQAGFSLVEVMVALGVMGILMFTITTVMESQYASQNRTISLMETTDFINELNRAFSDQDRCFEAIGGQTTKSDANGESPNIRLNIPSGVIEPGHPTKGEYGKALFIKSAKWSKVTPTYNNEYIGYLDVEIEKTGFGASAGVKKSFEVFFEQSANKISKCLGTSEGNGETTCAEIGGDWNGSMCDLARVSCLEVGGKWKNSDKSCDLMSAACGDLGGTYTPGNPGKCDICPVVGLGPMDATGKCTAL